MLARGKGGSGESAMTVIIVAHRLSTVRSADRIFVIKEGKVVEQGSHDELVKDPHGAYSSLICRQMQAQQKLEGGHESPTRRKVKDSAPQRQSNAKPEVDEFFSIDVHSFIDPVVECNSQQHESLTRGMSKIPHLKDSPTKN